MEIGKRDLTLEARSVQDLRALSDVELLWDTRDDATGGSAMESDGRVWEIAEDYECQLCFTLDVRSAFRD